MHLICSLTSVLKRVSRRNLYTALCSVSLLSNRPVSFTNSLFDFMQHQIYANATKAVLLSGWLSASLDESSGHVYRQRRGKSCVIYAELHWLQQFFIWTVLRRCMCSACLRLFIAKYIKWQITIVNNGWKMYHCGSLVSCVDLMGFNGPSLSWRLPQVSVYRLFGERPSRQAFIMCSIGKMGESLLKRHWCYFT